MKLLARIAPRFFQKKPALNAIGTIELEYQSSGFSNYCFGYNPPFLVIKMVIPIIPPRIKKRHIFIFFMQIRGDIRTFINIANETTISQVAGFRFSKAPLHPLDMLTCL